MNKKDYDQKKLRTAMLEELRGPLLKMYEIVHKYREIELSYAPNKVGNTNDFNFLRRTLVKVETAWMKVRTENLKRPD